MGKIIQIIEDDQDISFILEFIVSDLGFVPETFGSIQAFLNRTQKDNVNLFLIDVRLPDGNGIELSKALKESASTSNIPVIVMSAHANREDALKNGKAEDFLAKPFDIELLMDKIRKVV
jgi:FixJ family two-component response regulator